MMEITCPICKVRILVVPDLKEMTKAIDEHVNGHLKNTGKENVSKSQVQCTRDELEELLTEEVLKGICRNLAFHPNFDTLNNKPELKP